MARKDFPSDHRRYFRVMEDVIHNSKLVEVPEADCWLWVQLLAVLNQQKSRDGTGHLPKRSICAIARRNQFEHVAKRLDRLAAAGLLTWSGQRDVRETSERPQQDACELARSQQPASIRFTVPKWSEKQGFTTPPLQPHYAATPAPTPIPIPSPIKTPVKKKTPPPDWAIQAASELAKHVQKRRPGANLGRQNYWALDIAKIKAEPLAIAQVIDWLYSAANEGRYRIEVQSGRSLKDKYGKVIAAIERYITRRTAPTTNPKLDRIRNGVSRSKERDDEPHTPSGTAPQIGPGSSPE